MDLQLLEHFMPYLVLGITITLATTKFRGTMPRLILGDLLYLTLKKPGVVQQPMEAVSKKQEKKLQQQIKAAQGAAPELSWGAVSQWLLDRLEFTEDFDYLVLAGVVVMINAVGAVLMKLFVLPAIPTNIITLSLTGFSFIIVYLIRVEWAHGAITRADKIYMLIAAAIGAVTSFAVLVLLPAGLTDFRPTDACGELLARLHATVEAKFKQAAAEMVMPEKDPKFVAVPLALTAGMLSALLMAPGLRYGRVLQQMLKPPMWARHFPAGITAMRFAARTAFVLQVLLIPLWVTPLTDALFIPEPALRYTRGAALLLAGLLQGAALPQLVQSFLYTAPYQANVIRNTPDLDANVRQQLLKQQCALVLSQLCKCAMQLSFAPMLLMLCAFLHILTAFPSPLAEASPKAFVWDKKPSELYQCIAGFLGWWTSCTFVFWASLGVMMSRLTGIE